MSNIGKSRSIKTLVRKRDWLVKKISKSSHSSVTFNIEEMRALEWALKFIKKTVLSQPDSEENSHELVNELIPDESFADRKGIVTAAYGRIGQGEAMLYIGSKEKEEVFEPRVERSKGHIRADELMFPTD